jgi:diguanylate cyclase (GGDEF)-like protein
MDFAQQDRVSLSAIAAPVGSRSGTATGAPRPNRRAGGPRWLLAREAMAQIALVAVMIAVVWGSIALHLTQQRQEVAQRADRESANLAHAAAESIGQTIAGVDDALRFMEAVYASDPKHFDIGVWAGRANRTRGVALEFAIFGPDGKLFASSLGPANASTDFSDRDFFKFHVSDPAEQMFISKPILGRTSGRWSILFTRRIAAVDGWFLGVMAASVDPLWLTQLHRKLDIGRGSVLLVGGDGLIRALSLGTEPTTGKGVGQDISQSVLLAAAAKAERGTTEWVSPIDGTRQTVSFARLPSYAAIVAVSLNTDDVFAPYWHYARQYEIFGGGLTWLILLVGGVLLRNTRRLMVSRKVLEDAVDAISQGIVMVDANGQFPVINRRARDLARSPMPPPHGLLPAKHDGTALPADMSYEETRDDGKVIEVRTHPLDDGGAVRTYTDITERKEAEARIMYLAVHDALTGLPNRRLFADALADAIVRAKSGGSCAVLSVDLDKFSYVNDLYGHRCGDVLLSRVADRLRSTVRATDVVARFGGDEFCVLLPSDTTPADAETLARATIDRLSEPYDIDGFEIVLSACIGVALCPLHGNSADHLLTNADTALQRAKARARGTVQLYDPAMDLVLAERRLLDQDLRLALAQGQMAVFYQPIFDTKTVELAGFEALVRWRHPTRGFVSPDVFISIAEESGSIVELGQWVLATAFAEATRWPQSVRLSVNLSPKQFSVTDIVGRIETALIESGFAADRLTLELTEGVLIDRSDRALSVLNALKALGIRIALDDFGTGYSSLSYLRRFPFDSMKIDKSFVVATTEDQGARTIVRAIVALAANLDLNVVAEGVETTEHLEFLRAAGCPQVQGFLLGRPAPPDEIGQFMKRTGDIVEPVAR